MFIILKLSCNKEGGTESKFSFPLIIMMIGL